MLFLFLNWHDARLRIFLSCHMTKHLITADSVLLSCDKYVIVICVFKFKQVQFHKTIASHQYDITRARTV